MKYFLYVINKNAEDQIDREFAFSVIDGLKSCKHKFDYHVHENIQCFTYSNEPGELNAVKNDYFFSFAGQLARSEAEIEAGISSTHPSLAKQYIKDIPGAYALSFAHFPTKTVRVYTHFSRINPVYYFENEKRIVLGIDPLLVSCLGNNTAKPVFDLDQSVAFLVHGYFSDNNTLFEGVKAVPQNNEVCVENNEMTISDIDDSIDHMFTKTPTDADYDELTDLYLRAFDVVPHREKPHHIGLTGGKDSRLIALGLIAKDLPFHAYTKGFDDHPDVIIAKQLAEKLGIHHNVDRPVLTKENTLEVDLAERIVGVMQGTSGVICGYENINYLPEFVDRVGVTGVGAEPIRGGYGGTAKQEKSGPAGDALVSRLFTARSLIRQEKQQDYYNFLMELAEREPDFRKALYKHYVFYRTSRWAGGTRSSLLYTGNVYSPFFDNNFLKKAVSLDIDSLFNEKLSYNIMKRLDPEVTKIPFFESRWAFEEKGPANPNEYKQWLQRNPVYAKTKIGAYNWRMLSNEEQTLKDAFKDILLEDPAHEIFNVVDYEQLQHLLSKPVPRNRSKFIWSVASLKLYMNHFAARPAPAASVINVKIPDAKLVNTVKHPEFKDLTPTVQPTNNAISLRGQTLITFNKKSKGNPYLQTGNNNFKLPPTENLDVLHVEGAKKLFVRFCFESEQPDVSYRLFIMFYDEKDRIASASMLTKAKEKITYAEKEIEVKPKAKYVKFAVKLETENRDQNIKLNYAFMKLS